MRLFEMMLVLSNLLVFTLLVMPIPVLLHWLRYSVWLTLLLAGLQVFIEGPRWPMAPAYLLAGVLFLFWLVQARDGLPLSAHGLGGWLVAGLGVFILAISAALPLLVPVFRFEKPTGPYAIGTLTYHWVDTSRLEIFTLDREQAGLPGWRELVVQIWYPAQIDQHSPRTPYLPEAGKLMDEFARVQGKPVIRLLGSSQKYVTTHTVEAAPVAAEEPSYPVLIFMEGSTGFRQMNTFQVEELVSQGYIVVVIDHPYAAASVVFPDGRQAVMPSLDQFQPLVRASYIPPEQTPVVNGQVLEGGIIPYLAQDVIFSLDQLAALNQADPNQILTGKLDLQRVGALGVSMGGIVASEACRLDDRFQACLFMDAAMAASTVQSGLQQPGMWITRDAGTMRLERQRAGGWPEIEIAAHLDSMRAVYASLPGDGYFVQVPGIFHSNFTDIPAWSPLIPWLGLSGPVEVQRGFDILNGYSLAFFDRHVKGELPAGQFDALARLYPEVILETRREFPAASQ